MTDILRKLSSPRGPDSYRDISLLGRGGMASVERVHDARLDREVARKLLPLNVRRHDLGAADRRRVRRFLDEAFVQSRLQHPAFLPVLDLGIDVRGQPYFTMPIVQGTHFGEVIASVHARDGSPWTRERALHALAQVCEAVGYAHGRGVVHRDLKPENIMVGDSGEVFVMDFGLALVREPSVGASLSGELETLRQHAAGDADVELLTLEGDVVGTPAYMAPEQAAGDHGSVDPRSDQYALGAVLYQLLTGVRPYGDRSSTSAREVVNAVRQKPPTPVHVLAHRVPAELCAICERAMARDPGARYAAVADLAADLRAFLEQRVVRAHATGWRARARAWLRRNRWQASASVAAALMLAGGVAAVLSVQRAQQTELRESAAALHHERTASRARLEELRRQAYIGDIGRAQRLRAQRRDPAEVRAVLDRCEPELRGWEWRFLASSEDLAVHTFRHADAIQWLTLSEDGSVLGSSSDDGFVKLWDTRTGALRREIRVGSRVGAVALSADLRHVALGAGDSTVRLHDASTGELLAKTDPLGGGQTIACFSPDGALLVTGGNDKHAHVWRVPGLERVRSHPTREVCSQVLVHPEGGRVATIAGDTVAVFDLESGAAVFGPQTVPSGGAWHLAFDRAGTKLRALGRTALLELDLASGSHVLRPLPAEPSGVRRLLAEGTRVVATEHGRLRILDASSPTPSAELAPGWQGHAATIVRLTADPSGRWLLSGDARGVIKQWDLETVDDPGLGLPVERLLEVDVNVHDLAVAPDGSMLVAACADGTLRAWRLDRDEPARAVASGARSLVSVAFLNVPSGPPQLVTLGNDVKVRFHDGASLEVSATHVPPGGASAERIRTSEDGRWIAIAPRTGWRDQCGLHGLELRGDSRYGYSLATPAASKDLAISADGRVATADFDGRLRVHDPATRRKLVDVELETRPLRAVAWSPDGTEIAAAGETRIHLVTAATGTRRAVLLGHASLVEELRWSRDGSRLFSLGDDEDDLKVWDPHTGLEHLSLTAPRSVARHFGLDLSADARVLAWSVSLSSGSLITVRRLR